MLSPTAQPRSGTFRSPVRPAGKILTYIKAAELRTRYFSADQQDLVGGSPMRVMMIQPNYHSGGAEIAGNWPPGWVAYIGGALKTAGITNIRFVDAMTNYIPDDKLAEMIRQIAARRGDGHRHHADDLPGAEDAADRPGSGAELHHHPRRHPSDLHVRPGAQRSAWIDYIVRGEGEEITVNLMRAIQDGTHLRERRDDQGPRLPGRRPAGGHAGAPGHQGSRQPDAGLVAAGMGQIHLHAAELPVAVPNFARGCPFTCRFCSQWKFWRQYRTRDPKKFVDEVETLVRDHNVGFFILADEEPTINRKKFIALARS